MNKIESQPWGNSLRAACLISGLVLLFSELVTYLVTPPPLYKWHLVLYISLSGCIIPSSVITATISSLKQVVTLLMQILYKNLMRLPITSTVINLLTH
jgi:hypothetical protein